MKSLALQFR